jgi:glycerol kinase
LKASIKEDLLTSLQGETAVGQRFILTLDQGTTSSRAILFDDHFREVASAQREFPQIFPQDGWVEHDAVRIWTDMRALAREVLGRVEAGDEVAALGITNQRETTVLWNRKTGEPLANAIVWQDRRTSEACDRLRAKGWLDRVQEKTGLLLDPYFSGTKLAWLLDTVEGARAKAEKGELAFGTIDSWLIWNLTEGDCHVTDATNASRTLLFNINNQEWDKEILEELNIPTSLLPKVLDCASDFGIASAEVLGRAIPIFGVAGDQQAATVGQACIQSGMMKSTYGTGCFALLNTGHEKVVSQNQLLSTIAYRTGGTPTYAIEGSIFMAGATIQWVRDGMKLISSASESEGLAKKADPKSNVYMIPAFTGLGAPYWDPHARGAILGMTRDTGVAELVRAALESVSFQTRDLMEAMTADVVTGLASDAVLRVDGGMVANDWFLQNLSDLLGRPVERPSYIETTALGAAYLAGLQAGLFSSLDDLGEAWQLDRGFEPQISEDERSSRHEGWKRAVARILSS